VIDIAKQPAALHARSVDGHDLRGLAERELAREVREIHACIDRELQRPPKTAVDLHQESRSGPRLFLELHHRDAVPAQWSKDPHRVIPERLVDGCAFAQNADPAARRLLT
jgi:hypothetical protein